MISEEERLANVARFAAICRAKNRAAGIPDMELGQRHLPCEYFAQVGFHWVLEQIGQTEPDADWSEDGGTENDHCAFLAARRTEHQRVADWLRRAEVKPRPNHDGATFGEFPIKWPDRVPGLKTWAGRQTLTKLIHTRQLALPETVEDIITVEAPITGASGIDRGAATTALEDGFSVDALKMQRMTRIGAELLAVLGLETFPLTVYPDGRIGYEVDGQRYVFSIEPRGDYYKRWGIAEIVRT